MTRWLEAANGTIDVKAEPRPVPVLSVTSVLSEGERLAPPPYGASSAAPQTSARDKSFPHGACALTGKPRTWTGKIVALHDWRRLSEWEREGPAGRLFCGLCREWVKQDGGCHEAGCWGQNNAG